MSSLRRFDVLALAHLRNDGRKPNEIRRIKIEMGCSSGTTNAISGSCLFSMGLTTVLATVHGPAECKRRSDERPDRAVLSASVRLAPYASSSSDRRTTNPSTDRRLLEQSNLVQRAMEAAVLTHLYPRSRIDVQLYVLADDGGRLSACINASTCALVDAGVGLRDMVCSCSAGLGSGGGGSSGEDGTPLVDLNRMEMMGSGGEAAVHLPCATMPQRGTVVLSQCESRLTLPTYERVLSAAVDGCDAVFDEVQAAVRERTAQLLAARNGGVGVAFCSGGRSSSLDAT